MNIIKHEDMKALEPKMAELMPNDVLKKEISFALQAINNSPRLQECSKESLMKAVYNIATTGLSLNPVLKYAYLIPRWSPQGMIAVLDPSYQGLIKLLTNTDSCKSVCARIVYEGDMFEIEYGTEAKIIHRPAFKSKDMVMVYAIALLPDGYSQFEVMDKSEIDEIMERSESYKAYKAGKVKSAIWIDHYGEMAKKTVIKRLFKYLPKSDRFNRVAEAIALSDSDYKITESQEDYLVSLIERSTYDHDTQQVMTQRVYQGISSAEYEYMVKNATMNQLDPVTQGRAYNQSDIKNKIKEQTGV